LDQEFSFGQWIRKRRNALGMTCKALAERVGYSLAMMRKIENDERRPSPQAAALLASALEIPAEQQDAFLKVSRQERAVDRLGIPEIKDTFSWQAPIKSKTNLPIPSTLFVSREDELGKLADMLQNPNCNLITLVGLAGIGKTRLAVRAAYDQLDRFPDGVYFVPLSVVDSHEMIASAVANALHFQFHEADDTQVQLFHYLQEKRMLLVLDNFEHLMDGACLIGDLLQTAPGIKLLVTSRERLNLQGEWVFEVEGLPYPTQVLDSGLNAIEAYGAVQLFLQGALRVDPGFRLSDENMEDLVHICQQMQGMPLGIELAAAWVRVLSCKTIAMEIETNLDFLRASARDISERHRSLRAALDHSWNLLSPREKEVFQRLSVFRGGFRREAAKEIAGASLHEIISLLDKSLLKRVGDDRYELHELVRQYAAAQLQSNPQELEQTNDRYIRHFAGLLEGWQKPLRSPRQLDILREISADMDNVRSAWGRMVTHRQYTDIHKSLYCLRHFLEIRGQYQEGEGLFGQAAQTLQSLDEADSRPDTERQVVLGILLAQYAYFNTMLGRYEKASAVMQSSLDLLRSTTDTTALSDALTLLAYLQYRQGELQLASQSALESLDLSRALDNSFGIAYGLIILSYIRLEQGEYEQAYTLSNESLAICRDLLGDLHGTADSLITLSRAAKQMGQYREAERWANEGLEISKATNDPWGAGQTLRQLGMIRLALGDTAHAEALLRQSVSLFKEIGDRPLVARTLIDLGIALREAGDYLESKQCFLDALRTALETQSTGDTLHAMVEMASTIMETGMAEMALELVTHSLQQPIADRELRERARQIHAQLVSQLTREQIDSAQARSRTESLESLAQAMLAAG
jgi:predicted ATPase/transcriptional regulator with XRE-family HTH domain